MKKLANKLTAPVPALPVDLFRIAAGLVVLGYLIRLFLDAQDFHSPLAIIDHQLGLGIFPFTWQPLSMGQAPLWLFYLLFSLAVLATLSLIAGIRPKLSALIAYIIVVCTLRHRFLVISVDDVICHLLLFWLILLPSGSTLALFSRKGSNWRQATVPGATVRLLGVNIAILYLVAGLTKWSSPMWLHGDALYTVLKLRPGYFSEVLTPAHLWFLRPLNYAALVLEPCLAIIPFLPLFSRLKYFLGLVLIVLHLGIIATLDVPFANLGCLAFLPILFHREIGARFTSTTGQRSHATRLGHRDVFAAAVVFFIAGAMLSSVTQVNWRKPTSENQVLAEADRGETSETVGGIEQKVFFGGLWCVGLIQQYRLLDWIDDRNFHVSLSVEETSSQGSIVHPETDFVPGSMRGSLTLAYLAGATWLPVPRDQLLTLRRSIHSRLAHRFARRVQGEADIRVVATIQRINPSKPSPPRGLVLTSFHCSNGTVSNHLMNLDL